MTVYEGPVYLSSPYGWRTHPLTGARSHHNGKDMVGRMGKTQRLVVPCGTVLQVNIGYNGGRGNNVLIRSDEDPYRPGHEVLLRYQHLLSTPLKAGQRLAAGAPVGTEGSTGDSTGSHCHFEVTVDGQAVEPSAWDGLPNTVGVYPGSDALPLPKKEETMEEAKTGQVQVEGFTPAADGQLELLRAPDVNSCVNDGAGGTLRWPRREYLVYGHGTIAGEQGASYEGVQLRCADGALCWAAKLSGRYTIRRLPLAEAEAAGLTAHSGANTLESRLAGALAAAKAALERCHEAAAAAETTLNTLEEKE